MLSLVQNNSKSPKTVAYTDRESCLCILGEMLLEPRSAKFFESNKLKFWIDEDDKDVEITEYQEDMF